MGWASGSGLMSAVIAAVKDTGLSGPKRRSLYIDLIDAFEDYDCDTLEECLGEDAAFDQAMKSVHPNWDIEEG